MSYAFQQITQNWLITQDYVYAYKISQLFPISVSMAAHLIYEWEHKGFVKRWSKDSNVFLVNKMALENSLI